jgi:hypothetical protein
MGDSRDALIEARFDLNFRLLDEMRSRLRQDRAEDEVPSEIAIQQSILALSIFKRHAALPSRITASLDGGVAICFVAGDRYADIECLNDGQILAVTTSRRERPVVWDVGGDQLSIEHACRRIRTFIDAGHD